MPDTKADEIKSLKGRPWKIAQGVETRELERAGVPKLAAQILAGRGVTAAEMEDYLDPKIRNLMPDPYHFKDMKIGVEHVSEAMLSGKNLGIWSDYDCDGATSGALLQRFFRMMGINNIPLRIPDRITEGYGPNAKGLKEMKAEGVDTVCILDAGIVAFEALSAAREAGLDVVVVDHHAAEEELPEAVAVINANRRDEAPGYENLCAAGMTFIFCVGVARDLAAKGYLDGKDGRPDKMPNLMDLLDLVALGTVADVVPLSGLNRAFVTQGLKVMSKRTNPGIAALAEVSGIKPNAPMTSSDCGWRIGPRINAGGRISDSTLGARCLATDDVDEAKAIAKELDDLNVQRKDMEASVTERAIQQFESREPGVDRGIVISVVPDAHEGVVGISAARLREAMDAPAIVLAEGHGGVLKGSARSTPGYDIGHGIIAARKAGLIVKGGGHGMAGGLSLEQGQLKAFEDFMNEDIKKSTYFEEGVKTQVDLDLPVHKISTDLIDGLSTMEPFGAGNEEPTVMVRGAQVRKIYEMKGKHFKLNVGDHGKTMDVLFWNVIGSPIEADIRELEGKSIDVIGKVSINEYNGKRTPQMIADDIRPAAGLEVTPPQTKGEDQYSMFPAQ